MVPMRTSWIFRSRWLALVWAAGIIWFAVSVAGGSSASSKSGNSSAEQATDVTGAPITPEAEKNFESELNQL
jgi:hypothetical protein